MRRLFSTFAHGPPGVGLLLMRLSAGMGMVVQGVLALVATGCTMHTRTTGVQGVTKEVSHVRTFQGPCVGALSLDEGGYPYHHPSTPTQTAGAAADPDRVWRNRSGRGRADRCAVAGF